METPAPYRSGSASFIDVTSQAFDARHVPYETMPSQLSPFLGAWRIVHMELWGPDYLDLEVPAHITFESDRLGSFQFGAVRVWIDYRITNEGPSPKVEFSWEGFNDADPSCGRGWAAMADEQLVGRLYLHNSDDSAFVAERLPPAGPGRSRPRR